MNIHLEYTLISFNPNDFLSLEIKEINFKE